MSLQSNDHLRYPKFVALVERWSLFRSSFMSRKLEMGPQNDGRCRQVVVIWRWSLVLPYLEYAVKLVYNDHPRNPKIVVVVDRWSLFRGTFKFKMGHQNGGRYRQVVAIQSWSLDQV